MKFVRIAIFLTGIMGLLMGGVTTVSGLKSSQDEALLKTHEQLKSEATLMVDQLFGVLDTAKSVASNPGWENIPNYITHRAVVKLKDGAPSEIESLASIDSLKNPSTVNQQDFSLEERVLSTLKSELAIGDLRISKISYGTYALNDIGSKEGIFVAVPVQRVVNGVVDPTVFEKVNVVLVDPARAFSSLEKVSGAKENAYLLNRKGKVLAHTHSAFIGTDLKKQNALKETIENLFLGAQTGSVGKYNNLEGNPQNYAFVRAGVSPFAFGIEQRALSPLLSSAWVNESIHSGPVRENIGLSLVVFAIALMLFSGISIYATKKIEAEMTESRRSNSESQNIRTPIAPLSPAFQMQEKMASPASRELETFLPRSVEAAVQNFSEAKGAEQELKREAVASRNVLEQNRGELDGTLERVRNAFTAEAIEQELVKIGSEMTESPVLFFRYHRRNQSLTLTSLAGDVRIPNYTAMQAYVRKDIELQVEQLAEEGKVASVTNYGPINKLMISHLNVAHFEAWAVTSSSEVSGQARLVGVMIILQAGIKSAQARPLLARVLKETGNYLYAASSKLKPKSQTVSQTNPSNVDSMNL